MILIISYDITDDDIRNNDNRSDDDNDNYDKGVTDDQDNHNSDKDDNNDHEYDNIYNENDDKNFSLKFHFDICRIGMQIQISPLIGNLYSAGLITGISSEKRSRER